MLNVILLCLKATPVVTLSPTAWHLSFAKFIQLRLNCTIVGCQAVSQCSHSFYRDYYQYFRVKDVVAIFRLVSMIYLAHDWLIILTSCHCKSVRVPTS